MAFHWPDLIPLVIIALLIFGPKRLPEMGSSIGKTIKEFQRSMKDVKEPEPPAATPVALPQADAQVQAAPKIAAPADNPIVSAAPVESAAE